jgi:thiol-disulfide isomerase/thioredoxin
MSRNALGFSRLVVACALAAVVLATGRVGAQAPPAPADPKFTAALQQGEAALKQRKWQDGLEAFRTANAMLDKKSAAALYGVARSFQGLKAFKSAADACREGLKYVGGDQRFEAVLHNQLGMALFSQAEKNTDKVIKDAEAEFRAALALKDAPPITHYNLGIALLKQSRDEEGIAALKTFTDSGAKTPEVDLARGMIENPRRARENFAPAFSLTSMQGEFFSNKELEGKVVYLDFWGQWCGPCRALTPDLVKLNKKYKDNPNFVMIGISSDARADEQKWRDYISQNKMEWVHFLDLRHQVINAFQIDAYPTGVVIGPDGIMLLREVGGGIATKGTIEDAIKKGLKMIEPK